VKRFKKKVHSI